MSQNSLDNFLSHFILLNKIEYFEFFKISQKRELFFSLFIRINRNTLNFSTETWPNFRLGQKSRFSNTAKNVFRSPTHALLSFNL